MRILVAVLLLTVPVLGQLFSDLNEQWEGWKTQFQKMYQDQDEMAYRRMVWEKNLKLIEKHNQEASAGLHTFTMGLNHLADMTTEEINTKLNGAKMEDLDDFKNVTFEQEDSGSPGPLPRTVDWRKEGWVTPVRDQGYECGSCWAFAAVGALEGQMKRVSGRLTPLSPQNLIDCSTQNHGCNGGWVYKAFDDVRRNGGINSEKSYPYKAKAGRCNYRNSGKAGYCKGYIPLPKGNEYALKKAVARVGPIAVSIVAKNTTFHLYKGGVFNVSCSKDQSTNHAVLVVGYGRANGQDYWLVKNSWSAAWGEGGYIRMARNKRNLCHIASHAVYPKV